MLMNEEIFIVLAESTRGGLFDIGATLPLVAIQFLILMFILNVILYKPLITLVNERNESIFNNLNKASEILLKASNMSSKYEEGLIRTKKEAKQSIVELQKIQKEKFDTELRISQKSLDSVIQKILENFSVKKQNALNNIENEVNSLTKQVIANKLF
jgi:F-type H+-transporting ATPase subunit b